MILEAPWPAVIQITHLPDPLFGDGQALSSKMVLKRSILADTITHIKTTGNRFIFNYSFNLTRMKFLELRDFFEEFAKETWRITDQHDRKIVGKCKTNPLVGTIEGHSVYCPDDPLGSNERVNVSIEFEGTI